MITSLFIKNFILIDELNIDFESGFGAICGETGAGKSVILKALDTVLGGKGNKELIKQGAEKSLIEACFQGLSGIEISIDDEIEKLDDEIIISREIGQTASKFRVNGALVNAEYIKKLGEKLVDIHTQHQTYAFLTKKYHIKFLDDYIKNANPEYAGKLSDFEAYYKDFIETKAKIQKIEENNSENLRRADFLRFQIGEIENLALEPDEEENLREELNILADVEEIKEVSYKSFWGLMGDENSIISALSSIESNLNYLNSKDKNVENILNEFYDGYENLKACAVDLRNYTESLKNDPERLDFINERLAEIEKLKRKYGEDLFEALNNFQKELEIITVEEGELEALREKVKILEGEIKELSTYLSTERKKWANILSSKIITNLEELELKNAKFLINIDKKALSKDGIDDVEFLMSANAITPLAPIQKSASGGELSRIMLSLKAVFSDLNNHQTMILDEIDTGISGKTSQAVSNLISELSKKTQILAITHQPIIASKAKNIYWVQKTQTEFDTKVAIEKHPIENAEKILAQMASGIISQASLDFATGLINRE